MSARNTPHTLTGRDALEHALRPPLVVRLLPVGFGLLAVSTTVTLIVLSYQAGVGGSTGLLLMLATLLSASFGLLGVAVAFGRVATDAACRAASHVDPASGAASLAYFENECRRTQASGAAFGLLVVELSGTMAAPFAVESAEEASALRWAATQARRATRTADLVGRLPGLRLGVLLSGPLTPQGADVVLERLTQRLDPQSPLLTLDHPIRLRVMLGVAIGQASGSLSGLLQAAQQRRAQAGPGGPAAALQDETMEAVARG